MLHAARGHGGREQLRRTSLGNRPLAFRAAVLPWRRLRERGLPGGLRCGGQPAVLDPGENQALLPRARHPVLPVLPVVNGVRQLRRAVRRYRVRCEYHLRERRGRAHRVRHVAHERLRGGVRPRLRRCHQRRVRRAEAPHDKGAAQVRVPVRDSYGGSARLDGNAPYSAAHQARRMLQGLGARFPACRR